MKTFSDEQSELRISALAERLKLAKSTVHRLASTLVEAGMLEQNKETGKYRLGLAVFELGSLVRRKIDISLEAKPWLMTLREQTGETVDLSILDHGGVVCVNFLESKKVNRTSSGIGLRKPVHCTAEGKALIAFQPLPMIERLISAGLARRTPLHDDRSGGRCARRQGRSGVGGMRRMTRNTSLGCAASPRRSGTTAAIRWRRLGSTVRRSA